MTTINLVGFFFAHMNTSPEEQDAKEAATAVVDCLKAIIEAECFLAGLTAEETKQVFRQFFSKSK